MRGEIDGSFSYNGVFLARNLLMMTEGAWMVGGVGQRCKSTFSGVLCGVGDFLSFLPEYKIFSPSGQIIDRSRERSNFYHLKRVGHDVFRKLSRW